MQLLKLLLGTLLLALPKAVVTDDSKNAIDCGHKDLQACTLINPYSQKRCLPVSWFCDGTHDCDGGTDEIHCPGGETQTSYLKPIFEPVNTGTVCPADHFQCYYICVPNTSSFRCNGKEECPGGTDEEGCVTTAPVIENCEATGRWPCGDGSCISVAQICDDSNDCIDGRDEYYCPEKDCYKHGKWPCGDGTCIEIWQICDNVQDCKTGRDELLFCPTTSSTTTSTSTTTTPAQTFRTIPIISCDSDSYRCLTSTRCIKHSEICDGKADCPIGEDEYLCDYKTSPEFRLSCIEKCLGVEEPNCTTTTSKPVTFTTSTTTTSTTTTPPLAPLTILTCPSNSILVCGKCIEVNHGPSSWQEAKQDCSSRSMWLFEIDDANCFFDVIEVLKSKDHEKYAFWTGALDTQAEDSWVWDHSKRDVPRGTPLWSIWKNKVGFVQEPQGGLLENCGSLESCPFRLLNDKPCSDKMGFLCEKEATEVIIPRQITGW